MLQDDITRLFIAFLISISILIFNDLAIFSIMGLGILIFTFTIILIVIDFLIPYDINKACSPTYPNGTDIFVHLFKDISEFFFQRVIIILFLMAQSYICVNEYNKYIENKTLVEKGKVTKGYDLYIKENYYAPSGHTDYELYFTYFNKDLNRTVRDIADNFGLVQDMRPKTTTKIIYYKDKAKVYNSVVYNLQPYRIIINLFFIFILLSPFILYVIFMTYKNNGYKIDLKDISNWFKELFRLIFSMPHLRDEYTYQNFKSEFKLLVQTIIKNKIIKIFIAYTFINFLINNILIYSGYFDIQSINKLKDTSNPIYFKASLKSKRAIKTFIKGTRYLHIYKTDGRNIVIDSLYKKPKSNYLGHIVPTYEYLLRLSDDKNIVKNLTKFTIKEYTFISRFFYPYYLPFYKYDPSRTNYKLYNGFRDYKQEILNKEKV